MGDLFLIILAIILIVEGKGSVILWVIGGIFALAVIAHISEKVKVRKAQEFFSSRPVNQIYNAPAVRCVDSVYAEDDDEETATLIFHPHYITDNEYECSACGGRFENKKHRCPDCGALFIDFEKDEEEWEEEFDEECDMDEEDGW